MIPILPTDYIVALFFLDYVNKTHQTYNTQIKYIGTFHFYVIFCFYYLKLLLHGKISVDDEYTTIWTQKNVTLREVDLFTLHLYV